MGYPLTKTYLGSLLILSVVLTAKSAFKPLSTDCKGNLCPTPPQLAHKRLPRSCLDHLRRGVRKCGYYKIYDTNDQSFPVYCDMNTEPGNAWTLVMSWSNKYRILSQFRSSVFKINAPVNENAPNWNLYRLTLARMQSIKVHSTHWRSTCSYPTHGVDFTDYVRGNFKDFDVLNFIGSGVCKKVEYVNIRGHVGIHTTSQWWQVLNHYTPHIDSSSKGCAFRPNAGAVSSEDNFGFHSAINPKFRCTANNKATTQWWFGGHL